MLRRSGSSKKIKSSSSNSSPKSIKSGKSIKDQFIHEKMKIAELEALATFREHQKTKKLAVEKKIMEEELIKAKARTKVIETQEELEKDKT